METPALHRDLAEAWNAFERGEHLQAEQAFRSCLTRPGRNVTEDRQARFGLGYALAFLQQYEGARALFGGLQREAAAEGDTGAEHRALHQVGMVERLAGHWEAALGCFGHERELIARRGDRPLEVAVNAYELGTVTQHLGRYAEAKTWFDLSLGTARQTDDPVAVGCAHRGLGDWHSEQGHAPEARSCWEAARASFLAAGSGPAAAEIERRLGSAT